MKIDVNVVGYKKGVSKAGNDWLKLACTYPATGNDKIDAVGQEVISVMLSGDDVSKALKSTNGHLVGSIVTCATTYANGKENVFFLDIKAGK